MSGHDAITSSSRSIPMKYLDVMRKKPSCCDCCCAGCSVCYVPPVRPACCQVNKFVLSAMIHEVMIPHRRGNLFPSRNDNGAHGIFNVLYSSWVGSWTKSCRRIIVIFGRQKRNFQTRFRLQLGQIVTEPLCGYLLTLFGLGYAERSGLILYRYRSSLAHCL